MNAIVEQITADKGKIEEHFQYLHQHPGLAFEEDVAAKYIAGKLREWGYEVTEGIGKTGVVGQLKVGDGKLRIGLRADRAEHLAHEVAHAVLRLQMAGAVKARGGRRGRGCHGAGI